jgi:hypothetical protein
MQFLIFGALLAFMLMSCGQKTVTNYAEYKCSDLQIYNFEERAENACVSKKAFYVDAGLDDNCDEELQSDEISDTYYICSEEYQKPEKENCTWKHVGAHNWIKKCKS